MSDNRTGFAKAYIHEDIWGMMMNDALSRFLMNDNFDIDYNSSNTPPKILSGSMIHLHTTYTDDIPDVVTYNNCYPANTSSQAYTGMKFIKEETTVVNAFSSNGFPAQTTSVYYMYCYDCGSTYADRFTGKYGASTQIPTWSALKGGWYVSTEIDGSTYSAKVLGMFHSSGQQVEKIAVFKGESKEKGFISNLVLENSTGNIVIKKFIVNVDGKLIEYKQDYTIKCSTQITSTGWGIFGINENTLDIEYFSTSSTFANWNPNSSINKMDMFSLYDHEKHYCRLQRGTTYYRVLGIAKAQGTTGFKYLIPFETIPKSECIYWTSSAQSVISTSVYIVDSCDLDVNSEVATGANWNFSPNVAGNYGLSAGVLWNTSTKWTAGKQTFIGAHINSVLINYPAYRSIGNAEAAIYLFLGGGHNYTLQAGSSFQIKITQETTAALTVYNSSTYNQVRIFKI
jgi:hypothetical protein